MSSSPEERDPGLPLTTGEGNTADDPFNDAALLRLAASNMDYYQAHGHYVPPLALRLHATRAERDALREQLDAARQALERIAEQQPRTLANLRSHDVVFDGPLGADPNNWQDVAFTIYTDLCEVDSFARAALGVEGPAG